jgi:hypothetical protein
MGESELELIKQLFNQRFTSFETNVKEDITELKRTVAGMAAKMVTEDRLQSKMNSVKDLQARMAIHEQQNQAQVAVREQRDQAQEQRISNLEAFIKGFTSVLKWGLGILTALLIAVLIGVVTGWLKV